MEKFFIILAMIVFLTGCTANDSSQEKDSEEHLIKVKNSTFQGADRAQSKKISAHLESLAGRVPEVNGATAVVLGNYAIVGIDINSSVERSEAGVIKYSVAEALKDDPYGARAMVVADPDINARLKEMSDDINKGRPIQGIMNELADITGRLMPEVPGKLIVPDPDKATEKQKKKLNDQEDRKLEKEQEDESYNKK